MSWTLTGKDEAALQKAEKRIQTSIKEAGNASHQGKLWVTPSAVPRIIGRGGSGLMNIQKESGAAIEIRATRADSASSVAPRMPCCMPRSSSRTPPRPADVLDGARTQTARSRFTDPDLEKSICSITRHTHLSLVHHAPSTCRLVAMLSSPHLWTRRVRAWA